MSTDTAAPGPYVDTCETCFGRDPEQAPYRYTTTAYLVMRSGRTLHAEFRHHPCGTWWWNEYPSPE